MAKHTPGPWEMEMDSNADYIVRNKQEFAQLQHENKRLRKALEEIRDAKPTIPNTISYLPSKPTKLQKIASQALEGGNTNG